MSVPDITWDGTGTHAAHIIQALRAEALIDAIHEGYDQ